MPDYCNLWGTTMTDIFFRAAALRAYLAAMTLAVTLPVTASPGAHGPNGEHLDAPASSVGSTTLPRLEAKSDQFELAAELKNGQLQIYVDRYVSNEPVANASVEVEFGNFKAQAVYQTAAGYYVLEAPGLLKALGEPDQHSLAFTILAGDDSDLLNGILDTRGAHAGRDDGHSHPRQWAALVIGGLLVTGLAAVAVRRPQLRMKAGGLQ